VPQFCVAQYSMSGKVEEASGASADVSLIGAVFDLDGTLLATEEAYLEAYTKAAERLVVLVPLEVAPT